GPAALVVVLAGASSASRRPCSAPGRNAGRVDPAERPGDDDAGEEEHRDRDADGEGAHHVAAFRAVLAATAQHRHAGPGEGGEDDGEAHADEDVHRRRLWSGVVVVTATGPS